MDIDTGDSPPIKRKQCYDIPLQQRVEVERLIRNWLKGGIIQPSQSPWKMPMKTVFKKDGTIRIVIDFRALNKVTKKDVFP